MNIRKILKIVAIVVITIMVLLYGLSYYTKLASPQDIAELKNNDLTIKVVYCQPSAKDRVVFGKVVPYGKVWRTGANQATEITFSQDVKLGDKSIKAGTYTLFTIPTPEKWTIILNSVLGQWGAFFYDESKDVIRTEVKPTQNESNVEKFKITLQKNENAVDLVMVWAKTKVSVPIEKK